MAEEVCAIGFRYFVDSQYYQKVVRHLQNFIEQRYSVLYYEQARKKHSLQPYMAVYKQVIAIHVRIQHSSTNFLRFEMQRNYTYLLYIQESLSQLHLNLAWYQSSKDILQGSSASSVLVYSSPLQSSTRHVSVSQRRTVRPEHVRH